MSNDNTYNGWTNYETWVVNLWLDNDQGMNEELDDWASEAMQEAIDADESDVRASACSTLAKRIESFIDDQQEGASMPTSGMFADLLSHALGMVDWREIAEHHINEITLYSAGWNLPGCMPDNPPSLFIDASDALDYIHEQIENANNENDASDLDASFDVTEYKADSKGEFGQTIGAMHYFVSII